MLATHRSAAVRLLRFALTGSLLAAPATAQPPDPAALAVATSTSDAPYATPALAALVRDAVARNRLPAALEAYRADVETEIALVIRRADGTEAVGSVEQIASRLRWTRLETYDQRVQGHRMQQVGAGISVLSGFRTGWLNPTLYGNRIRARQAEDVRADTTRGANRSRRVAPADTAPIVHPLAEDRERWYRYEGGDTLVTLRVGERSIPVVRVVVRPREDTALTGSLFRGEMHLDASRGTLVRLRGAFEPVGVVRARSVGPIARAVAGLTQGAAFIDYENGEKGEQYWLPTTQRIELQVATPALSDGRAVVRIVSRFRNVFVNDTTLDPVRLAASRGDSTMPRPRRRLSFDPPAELRDFAAWQAALGDLSDGMHSDDFDSLAGPDRWRTVGLPRFDWGVPNGADFLRINRVEGVFTGFGARLALRDLSPGTIVRATAGHAWEEGAVRGRVEVQRDRGPWRLMARAGRSLDITNDFRNPLDSGSALGPLTGLDEYDYVDRRFAGVQAQRTLGARQWVWRVETGVADDRDTPARLTNAPIGRVAFRPNQHVDAGTYWRNAFTLAWRPDGSAEFMRPGWSGRLYAEQGVGALDYTRLEARLTARRQLGPFTAIARGDVGALLGASLPTQQLFELGRTQGLPGYAYKEFAGTRAAMTRALLLWTGPWWREPVRAGNLVLPPLAPGASLALQAGATGAPGAAGLAAVNRLGVIADATGALVPVARPSDGWRASASAGLRFFSGAVFVGGAQPLERGSRWRWLVALGQQL
jgi:hypothetical protein